MENKQDASVEEFQMIIHDILKNMAFQEIKKCKHHGNSRYDHCMEVAFTSYLVSKKLGWNYPMITRAALLHDFFVDDWAEYTKEKRLKNLPAFNHNLKAVANASKYFHASSEELEIIRSHMFPLVLRPIPRTKGAWLVSTIDKWEASKDWLRIFSFKFEMVASSFLYFYTGL